MIAELLTSAASRSWPRLVSPATTGSTPPCCAACAAGDDDGVAKVVALILGGIGVAASIVGLAINTRRP